MSSQQTNVPSPPVVDGEKKALAGNSIKPYISLPGGIAAQYYLPFYKEITLPPPPQEVPFLPTIVQESCGFKIITGGLMGCKSSIKYASTYRYDIYNPTYYSY
jgi:hypothetical protein